MKERPILFKSNMINAILDGRKTQTRRILKPQPTSHYWGFLSGYQLQTALLDTTNGLVARFQHTIPKNSDEPEFIKCRYGKPGERLWVRETAIYERYGYSWSAEIKVVYVADNHVKYNMLNGEDKKKFTPGKKPSIHMPRWASRIDLDVRGIRLERLQDISKEDAIKEGIDKSGLFWKDYRKGGQKQLMLQDPIDSFRTLWESISGSCSWGVNPWVWVIEFERV